jgi:hypothetical protein
VTRLGLLLGALAIGAVGCGGGEAGSPRACTLIGCVTGVGVTLETRPAATEAVRVCVARRCVTSRRPPTDFPVFLQLPDVHEERTLVVTVRFLAKNGHVLRRTATQVRLRARRPNGPSCPPICYHAGLVYRDDHLAQVSGP